MDATWHGCYPTRDPKVKSLMWLLDSASSAEITMAQRILSREDFVIVNSTQRPRTLPPGKHDDRRRFVVEVRCSNIEGQTVTDRRARICELIDQTVNGKRNLPVFADGSQPTHTTSS